MIYEFHQLANIFPLIEGSAFQDLVEDIAQHGIREPIWLYEGKILDGRNRYKACLESGSEIKTREYTGNDPLGFVVSLNLKRRHLDTAQRAMVASRLANMRQGERTDITEISAMSQPEAAAMLNVSTDSVQFAKKVLDQGDQSLIEAVDSGKVSISAAAKIATKPKEEQKKIASQDKAAIKALYKQIKAEEKAEKSKKLAEKKNEVAQATSRGIAENRPKIFESDCNDFLQTISEKSVDLLITDPPYSTEVSDIELFAQSWLFNALSKVNDTGRVYICIGAYPNEVKAYLTLLSQQTRFIVDCPLIWTYRNTLGVTPKYKYNLNYQVILHLYTDKSRHLDTSITNEMFSVQDINAPDGRNADRFHTWQKPDDLGIRLVRHSTEEGDTVIDPFTCTGTFLIAAAKLKRKAIGCDISKEHLKIAEKRGCDVIYK